MSDNRDEDSLSMIVVMGVTGSGKSYFINQLAGNDVVKTGDDLHSCTANCELVLVEIGGSKVALLDTPGFDDSTKSDSEILTEISRILAAQYQTGVSLKGVIYLHRIIDVRYSGSSVKTLEIFKKICGDLALKNVILVTTRWHQVDDAVGASREQQLRTDFWAYMLGHGSNMARFYGNRDSAIGIISQLVSRQSMVLELQRELNEGKTLEQTVAGAFVHDELSDTKAQLGKELKDLEDLKQTLKENDRVLKRKAQQDWDREHQRLMTAGEDEARLRRNIATEVRAEIAEETKKKKRRGLWKVLPFVAFALDVMGTFVGIPPGSMSVVTSWL
ncbi:gTPase, IMAP member 8 [Pseudocyphellaria aurata]|nr:gTPase, IMAP member 8 [Pseudocyphellaria aurata]